MFFLKLAAECIRLVNLEKDKNGDNWAKKAMVQCGIDVPRDGVWKIGQLEKRLAAWIMDMERRNICLSRELVTMKARELQAHLCDAWDLN
ncbi:hypothetical protein PR003_g18288, partial [Phytophthora rubi]